MGGKRLGLGDEAVTQLIGLLIAGAIFITILGTVVLVVVEQDAPETKVSRSQAELQANSLIDVLIGSPGDGWYAGGNPCLGESENTASLVADQVTRLGLAAEACASPVKRLPNNLSHEKLANLQLAAYEANPTNGHVDYEEALEALGIRGTGVDFHVRTTPVLPELHTLMAANLRDPNIRPLYVGDFESSVGGGVSPVSIEAGIVDEPSSVTLWFRTENLGTLTSVFEISTVLHLVNGDVELQRHTPPVPPLSDYNLTITISKSADWAWDSPVIEYTVSNPIQVVASGTVDASGIDMTSATVTRIFNVHAGKIQYLLNGESNPRIYYRAYDATGKVAAQTDWMLAVTNPLGLVVATDTNLHTRGWESFSLVSPDTYTVKLTTLAGTTLGQESMVVLNVELGGASPLEDTGWFPKASSIIEAAYIEALVQNFSPHVYDARYDTLLMPYADGGDVYPDIKRVINNDVAAALVDDRGTSSSNDDVPTLARYNVLIIGSNVDQQTMLSQSTRSTIAAWIDVGGILIVFGSQEQTVHWLEAVFQSSITAASGGLSAPDQGHPILRTPNDMDYQAYETHGVAWEFTREEDAAHFTHVLRVGENDLLAISNHGEFGRGRVILNAFQPYDLLIGAEGPACDVEALLPSCEGLLFVHNLLVETYDGIFVDYGPMLPTDEPVGSSTRLASVWHPDLKVHVALRVQVFVF